MTRAAVYARYSSNNQRDASIEDQVRQCKSRIEKESWTLTQIYSDAAISGATTLRPGYQKLLEDARAGAFDVVVAEALDRLSRDQEDVAGLYKRLTFANVTLITLAEGEISELHVGLKGTMNALYLKDLAQKTKRGLEGRVRQGKSGGGKAYGYDVIRRTDAEGIPIHGERRINEAEAAVVRRIFEEFATGHSPRAIARRLNADGVSGPGGRPWRDTTIRGHHTRRTGILRNDLYAGRQVWNKQSYRKDPTSGKRLARPNPESEWIVMDVPELRTVDPDLWDRVQTRLEGIRNSARVANARKTRFWESRRPRHLLTGLVRCGECGHPLAAVGKDYLACGTARSTGTCANRRGIKRQHLEHLVLDALKKNLMAPDLVEAFIKAFHEEVNKQRHRIDMAVDHKRKELREVTRRLDGLYEAIADGLRTPGLKGKLEELEARKAALEDDLSDAAPPAPRLHPNLAGLYRRKVENLHQALNDPASRTEAADILRDLIEVIAIKATDDGFEVELIGDIANMVELANVPNSKKNAAPEGTAVPDSYRSSVKVVAGARNCLNLLLFIKGLEIGPAAS